MSLTPPDFIVMVITLLIPLAIGIFYAWKDARNVSREEYLVGGRSMSTLPVALSIFATYSSAISLIGIPAETYLYGMMMTIHSVGITFSYIIGCFLVAPLLYPLRLTSMFEYLEMRYQSQGVRKLATITGMLQTFFYMILAMLAPGLAIQATMDTPFWLSVVVVGSIGTLYTAIGGIKSVIWTDAFQSVILCVGIVMILIFGTLKVGSAEKVYGIAKAGGRTSMDEIGLDPRIRHTWWGLGIGGMMIWMTNIFNQSSLQRIASTKSLATSKKAFIFSAIFSSIFIFSLGIIGLVIYAYFFSVQCEPIEDGLVSNANQIIFFYIKDIFREYPGIAGLYMATIFSGALSTLSSGINALATNTVEDILGGFLTKGRSEKTVTLIAKAIVFAYGVSIVTLTYFSRSLDGPITQIGNSIFGVFGSAGLSLILVGCTVPWANKYGAFAGAITGLVINIWIAVGARLYGVKPLKLSPVTTENCNTLYSNETVLVGLESISYNFSDVSTTYNNVSTESNVDNSTEYGFFLYDLSYMWYSLIGVIISGTVNLTVSKLTSFIFKTKTKTDSKLILPVLRHFWKLESVDRFDRNGYHMEGIANMSLEKDNCT